MRNTEGRSGPQGLEEPTSDEARLLYGDESGRNPRNHEESHYSESKTPTTRTEPRRRHRSKHSRSPSPIASVFRRLIPPSPRSRPQKEGGVFNRLGGKEQSASARADSRHQSSQAKGTEIQSRSPGRGRSAEMHEDVQGDYVFLQGEVAAFSHSRKKHPRRGNSQKEETKSL
ncbi:hypothetical protein Tco_0840949 [Tanacetum coccineum]|uniref:Uncharacterized protein n=1 Tax=Tanacetum coccineum TaxID=301880 RepID=A0ABQ5AXP4_9ASTR